MLCRLCLRPSPHLRPIFDQNPIRDQNSMERNYNEEGEKKLNKDYNRKCFIDKTKSEAMLSTSPSIPMMMEMHLGFKPLPEDNISTEICEYCWLKLCDFHGFYRFIMIAQQQQHHLQLAKDLLQNLENVEQFPSSRMEGTVRNANNDNQGTTNRRKLIENMKNTQKEPILENKLKNDRFTEITTEENINNNLDENRSMLYAREQHRNNPLFEIEIEAFDCDKNLNDSNTQDTFPLNETPEERSLVLCTSTLSDLSGSQDRIFYINHMEPLATLEGRDDNTSGVINDDKTETTSQLKSSMKVKMKRVQKNDKFYLDRLIKKHIPMACSLCIFIGQTFADIVKHFHLKHQDEKPYITCCDRKLTKRCYIGQHALKHENPDYFRCHDCQKSFSNNSALRAHILSHHAPDEQKPFICDICSQRFASKYLLELHKPSHVPQEERNFICTKCPTKRAFGSKYVLQIHDTMRHKREANVCHVCAKEIRDKRSFEKHVRLHYEDSGPRIKCPHSNCESWLKDEDNLKLHLRRHKTEEKAYKCPECGKLYKNQRALTSHKKYTHSAEVFPCGECNKHFKKAITLKEHMAQHTGEVLYRCPFCVRTFNSSANMHAHRKKRHPIEWARWRNAKYGNNVPDIQQQDSAQDSNHEVMATNLNRKQDLNTTEQFSETISVISMQGS